MVVWARKTNLLISADVPAAALMSTNPPSRCDTNPSPHPPIQSLAVLTSARETHGSRDAVPLGHTGSSLHSRARVPPSPLPTCSLEVSTYLHTGKSGVMRTVGLATGDEGASVAQPNEALPLALAECSGFQRHGSVFVLADLLRGGGGGGWGGAGIACW